MKLGILQHGVKYVLKTSEETGEVKDKRSGTPEILQQMNSYVLQ